MRKDCLGLSCIVLHSYYFLWQFVVWIVCQKTQNILQYHIFCNISGSKITTEHFSVSSVIIHSLPPEISVQYLLFIITVIIYNCICYSYVVNFIITTATTLSANITETFVRIAHNFQHFTVCQNFLPLLCPQYHFWVNSWTKWTSRNQAGWIPAIIERMLIATPNERLHYSLPIFRRKWHMISVLTWNQQQYWSPCSARVGDEESISNYRTQCSIYEWIILQQQKKPEILGYKGRCLQCSFISFSMSKTEGTLRVHIFDSWMWTFLNRKINSWIHNVTFWTDYINYYILKAQFLSNKEKPLAIW